MKSLCKGSILLATVCIGIIVLFFSFYLSKINHPILPTYFKYNDADLKPLALLNSDYEITAESLKKWDTVMFNLVKENKLGDAYASQVYVYIYVAQRDAAFLSHNVKNSYVGSIDAVSAKVLCLFFPNSCDELNKNSDVDSYSDTLSNIVVDKIKERMQIDKHNAKPYPAKDPAHYWAGIHPYFGQEVGSWKTWLIKSGAQFRVPPPPPYDSPEWKRQLALTKAALANIMLDQTKSVVFWAGNPGTITPPGQWLVLANDYMWSKGLPLNKLLLIRSQLAMGIADAVITIFDSKYTYMMKRPFMLDPTIKTVMPTPNFPSYPAGHSGISAVAATILTFYFPDNKAEWWKNAYEASEGRVWGGIHFPIDAEAGILLGKNVGEAVIKNK